MRNIYRYATFCIAATAAPDGTVGLFFDRKPLSLTPFTLDLKCGDELHWPPSAKYQCSFAWPDAYTQIDCAPLNQRGWVAQERYLSPRILHFARRFVLWECPDGITSETHPDGLPGWLQAGNIDDNLYSLKSIMNDFRGIGETESDDSVAYANSTNDFFWSWCKFRALYTSFNLTKESDILIALHGIAQDAGERLQDKLVAGLWRRRFIEDMCWSIRETPTKPYRPASWRAPSWSWASSMQRIKPSRLGFTSRGKVQDISEVLEVEGETNDHGGLVRATLTLRAQLLACTYDSFSSESTDDVDDDMDPGAFGIRIFPDEPVLANSDEKTEQRLMILRQHSYNQSVLFEGIVIERCDAEEARHYRRVGYWRNKDWCSFEEHWSTESQVITLV